MIRRFPWWLSFPFAALLVEGAAVFALRAICSSAYGGPGGLSEASELFMTYGCIGLGGLLGGLLAAGGTYFVLARSRLWVAIPVIALVCSPALAWACVYSYALLVLLALV